MGRPGKTITCRARKASTIMSVYEFIGKESILPSKSPSPCAGRFSVLARKRYGSSVLPIHYTGWSRDSWADQVNIFYLIKI